LQSLRERRKEKEEGGSITQKQSPVYSFMYALKSTEARRQYPKRLKMLLDFLDLPGSLEEQARIFLDKARQDLQWSQNSIIVFLDYHKQRVIRKEFAAGTLKNYYRAAKLFCEMNDLTTLNWKRISRGLPRVKNSSSDRAPNIDEIRRLCEYSNRDVRNCGISLAVSPLIRQESANEWPYNNLETIK
jgi:hypothetical protein